MTSTFPQIPDVVSIIPVESPIYLRAVSGIRGTLIALLPLLLITFVALASLLAWGVFDSTTYHWLSYGSSGVFLAVALGIAGVVRYGRRHTSVVALPAQHALQCRSSYLGAWTFSFQHLGQIEVYDTSDPARSRKRRRRQLITIGVIVAIIVVSAIIADVVQTMMLAGFLFIAWLIHRAEEYSIGQAGIILWFHRAKGRSAMLEPHRIHLSGSPSSIHHMLRLIAAQVDSHRPAPNGL